ncbi:MAG: hypothetical protein B6D35_09165 [Candidatus Brocadia sp. UTAMX2]|nr:MAG: hypothetical protein B6D35_09165 [Candidatus Brocadia sp. UTAMX2]
MEISATASYLHTAGKDTIATLSMLRRVKHLFKGNKLRLPLLHLVSRQHHLRGTIFHLAWRDVARQTWKNTELHAAFLANNFSCFREQSIIRTWNG